MRLLPWIPGVEAQVRMRVQDLGTRNPSIDQRPEPLRVGTIFESRDDIIRVTDDDHIARGGVSTPMLDPEIEDVMQVDVGQQR